ncbi:MAG: nucleotide modification associated domain-containing protein, partial [Algoriella sp.]
MKNTSIQFKEIISVCRDLYIKKLKDYGPAWRVLRLPSLTD